MIWILPALLAAAGSAATSLAIKRIVGHGGIILSTIAFRGFAAVLLSVVVLLTTGVPELTAAYWRIAALVMVPEVAGMICMALALREGDLSLVQPLAGFLPLFQVEESQDSTLASVTA